jgi:hypothetical protein
LRRSDKSNQFLLTLVLLVSIAYSYIYSTVEEDIDTEALMEFISGASVQIHSEISDRG